MQVVRGKRRRDRETGEHRRDRRQRFVRQRQHRGAEAAQAHRRRVEVVGDARAPGRVGRTLAPRHRPTRLAGVEIAGAKRADLLDHEAYMRTVAIAAGAAVEELGDGGDAPGRRRRRVVRRQGAQVGNARRHVRGIEAFARDGEVGVLDLAARQGLAVEFTRHQHAAVGHAVEQRADPAEIRTREAEDRVDRDEALERPEGRDAAAGLGDRSRRAGIRGGGIRGVRGDGVHGSTCIAAPPGPGGQKRSTARLTSVLR